MKIQNQIVTVLLLAFMYSGCGGSAPSPTDPEVKKLTLELCDELLRKQLLREGYYGDLDEVMKAWDISLSAIRILSKDDKIKRTEFAALLHLEGGDKVDIVGSAQYTEDGQVYVEVALIPPEE